MRGRWVRASSPILLQCYSQGLPPDLSDAEIEKQHQQMLAMRSQDVMLAAKRLLDYSKAHRNHLPKDLAEVQNNHLLRHEGVVHFGKNLSMGNAENFVLNPKLYGKPLDSLPESGVILVYVSIKGKPFPDADGRFFTAFYSAKWPSVRYLSPKEAKADGL
jgi:hypothetical protein